MSAIIGFLPPRGGEVRLFGEPIAHDALPDLVGGNINAPVVMIAERASDLIRGKAPLAAASLPN